MNRILVVRQDKLGDLLLSTPVFEALKMTFPEAEVVLACPETLQGVLRNDPFIDRTISAVYRPRIRERLKIALDWRRQRFEAALLLKAESGAHSMIARLAGIKIRVGATEKAFRGRLLTRNLAPVIEGRHEVLRNLAFAEALGAYLPEPQLRFQPLGAPPDVPERFVALCVGTGGTSHPLRAAHYAEIALGAEKETGLPVVLFGGPEAADLGAEIGKEFRGPSRIGQLNLDELALALQKADVVICGNTAPAHLAAAMGASVVMFEATPPAKERIERWRPWGVPCASVISERVCAGCVAWDCTRSGEACIEGLDLAKIAGEAASLVRPAGDR